VPSIAAATVRGDVVLRRIVGPLPSRSVMAVTAARPRRDHALRAFQDALSSAASAVAAAAEMRVAQP
jgi:hypothetical protein